MNPLTPLDIKKLEKSIGYTFKDKRRLFTALCHRSYAHEQNSLDIEHNERFEFLGDALLQLAVTHLIMERFPNYSEGQLSKLRAGIVNETQLSIIARNLNLDASILLGKGEEQSEGRTKNSILADTYEALLGAIYLDAGYEQAKKIVEKHFNNILTSPEAILNDYKTSLQELTQKMFQQIPEYILEDESGPPHDKTFAVRLVLDGTPLTLGFGKSKKAAQQEAARIAYGILSKNNNHKTAP